MIINRYAKVSLLAWKDSGGRKPLILRGARQVGKTHLMKWLGKQSFDDTAYFNFDEKPELNQFFEETKDVVRIVENLSLVHGKKITTNTLVIFDEIQACIPALNTLKYFHENAPDYAIVCAGSLLGTTLGKEASFPVGKVSFLDIHPLSFFEYLHAIDPMLSAYVRGLKKWDPLPDIFFHTLRDHFKKYLITGGLPEVASGFIEKGDYTMVDAQLRDIINSYKLDFSKHPIMKDVAKISYVWDSLSTQLARENKKFVYQLVRTGARAREYEDAIQWLVNAGLILKVPLCKEPRMPMSAYDDLSSFKLYLFDVGVLRKLSGLDPQFLLDKNRLFTEFKGALSENVVLQSLTNQFDITPRYWTSKNEAELDFLISYKQEIIPIEVKSDENIRSKSLSYYDKQFQPRLKIRYSMKNLDYRDGLLNIPIFLADKTKKLIEQVWGE